SAQTLGTNPAAQPLKNFTPPAGYNPATFPPTIGAWLKRIEANASRAQRGTVDERYWDWQHITGVTPPPPQPQPGQPPPPPAPPPPKLIQMATSANGGRTHVAGEDIVPTFVLRTEAGSDVAWAGRGDVVTVADDSGGQREEHWVT